MGRCFRGRGGGNGVLLIEWVLAAKLRCVLEPLS